jgi:hypothetical protein
MLRIRATPALGKVEGKDLWPVAGWVSCADGTPGDPSLRYQ